MDDEDLHVANRQPNEPLAILCELSNVNKENHLGSNRVSFLRRGLFAAYGLWKADTDQYQ